MDVQKAQQTQWLNALAALKHPLFVALAGLVLGALAQALFIGGQMSQRVLGVEAGLERIHDRLDDLYSRDMADRDFAKVQLQFSMLERRVSQLETHSQAKGPFDD